MAGGATLGPAALEAPPPAHGRGASADGAHCSWSPRRFVADASHELRTPLSTIRAHAEYASTTNAEMLPESTVNALARITAATGRMSNLVADLLLLAQLDAGRPLARETLDLTRLVLEAVCDARAAGPEHSWKLNLPQGVVTVTGDLERLHQVLAKLLANARTHTPPRTTVTTRIHVTALTVDTLCVMSPACGARRPQPVGYPQR